MRDRTIVNQSTVNWTSTGPDYFGFGAVWENQAGATLDLKNAAQIVYWGGTPAAFNNAGTLVKSGGTTTAYFDLSLQNSGTVTLQTGDLAFRQSFTLTAGRLELFGGNYQGSPYLLDIRGGVLEGAGRIETGVSVAGELRPGNPLGKLEITPNWNTTNTPTSRTFIQLGGTQPGVTFDQFFTGGSLNVGGELRVEFANGFEPAGGEAFEIMRGLVRNGTFSATNAPAGFSPELTYTSTNVTLRLIKTGIIPPQVTGHPTAVAVTDGGSATFSVTATGAGLSYQWRRNGVNIPNATASSLTLNPVTFSQAGRYDVVVSNTGGSDTSNPATLTVIPSSLDAGLAARYALDGSLVDSIGGRNGTAVGTISYRTNAPRDRSLHFDLGSYITLGATPAEPIIDAAEPFSTAFWIRPHSVQSMVPLRLATPEGEFAFYLSSGLNGDLATHFGFRGHIGPGTVDPKAAVQSQVGCWIHVTLVYLGGDKNLNSSYAAYFNGQPVSLPGNVTLTGGTGANELGRNIAGIGSYVDGDLDEVRIYGRVLGPEDAAALAANPPKCPPEIVTPPVGGSVLLSGGFSFAVNAIGGSSLKYQWYRNDESINGATSSVYVVNPATVNDNGTYRVRVSNADGEVSSNPVSLVVVIPPPPGLVSLNTGTTNFITGASFLNRYVGAISLRGGGVCYTGNGGVTWTPFNTGVTTDINAIQLIGGVGYIAGANGVICISTTTNSGAIWSSFNTGTSANFYGLAFDSPTSGWAVGSGGTICRYNGRTWVTTPTGISANCYSVAYGGGVPWAVGSGGTICRYSGGGWQTVDVNTLANFYCVAFRNASLGLAVGSGGTICRYNGTSWVNINAGISATIRSVIWVDDNTAYLTGEGGLLCISTNGGLTWTPFGGGGVVNFGGLAASGGVGFVFGAGGTGLAFTVPAQPANLPPSIRIIEPVTNQQFYACYDIPITAIASDPDGSVVKVEFFHGQFKLGETTRTQPAGRPFHSRFHTDVFGSYELRAVATDNLGAVTISDPVTIEVIPPPLFTAVAEGFSETDGMSICYLGLVGSNYVLQATSELEVPLHWENVSTNQMPDLLLRVTDPSATNRPRRFYRFLPAP